MTIPSRPAPPPPVNTNQLIQNNEVRNNYVPSTNRDDSPFGSSSSLASSSSNNSVTQKKKPPLRPPPPRNYSSSVTSETRRLQSVNLLSNIFNKKPPRSPVNETKDKIDFGNTTPVSNSLIDFNSPPSAAALSTGSNSDGVSVDSFSSDGNSGANCGFSSENTSQAESGFEDDFDVLCSGGSVTSSSDKWGVDPFSPIKQSCQLPPNISSASFYSYNKEEDLDINYLSNGKDILPPEPPRIMPTIIIPVRSDPRSSPLYKKKPTPVSNSKYRYGSSMFFKTDADNSDFSLPMPTVPPPTLPTVLPEIFVDTNEIAEPFGIAVYDYFGEHEDDLAFKEGDRIVIIRQLDSDWLFGRLRNGCEGMFPTNYIDVKISLEDAVQQALPVTKFITSYQPATVKALYTFNGETPEDLSFQEGADVLVLSQINSEWLYGTSADREGQFPANFIEYTPTNLPMK